MGKASDHGGALVELAIILPLVVVLLLGALDFGRAFYSAMAVTHAASAGVQYGAQSFGKSLDTAGMVNAAATAATDISGLSSSAARSCACWTASSGTEAAMGTCASPCTSPSVVRVYVTVTSVGRFTTFVNYPGIPHTLTITRGARMRVQ